MKKFVAALTLATLTAPVFVSALTVADLETQLKYLLGQLAFLQAQTMNLPVVCELATSKASVKVGEPFEFIWNSYGALTPSNDGPSQFSQNGISTVTMQKTGTFKHTFSFYGADNASTTCTTIVTVTQ